MYPSLWHEKNSKNRWRARPHRTNWPRFPHPLKKRHPRHRRRLRHPPPSRRLRNPRHHRLHPRRTATSAATSTRPNPSATAASRAASATSPPWAQPPSPPSSPSPCPQTCSQKNRRPHMDHPLLPWLREHSANSTASHSPAATPPNPPAATMPSSSPTSSSSAHAPKGQALRRSGASAGDALYVTGHLGGAAAELSTMFRRKRLANAKTTEDHPHLFPEPRLDVGEALLRRNLATACIDLSDGLSSDLAHLCRASRLNAEIEQAALPIHPLARKSGATGRPPIRTARWRRLRTSVHRPSHSPYAHITSRSPHHPHRNPQKPQLRPSPMMTLIAPDGTRTELKPGGWEHFAKSSTTRRRKSR